MKIFLMYLLSAAIGTAVMAQTNAAVELHPQPYYGKVAQEVVKRLERKHVLRRRFDDEMSRRAWTNLVSNYDFNRMVFLKSDMDAFAFMEDRIDDAIAKGDVSFVYTMHKVFLKRIQARVDYVTNLLVNAEFDFTVNEDYSWKRKDAAWPTTVEEQNELWRKRIKNEMLSIVLGRQLDKEELDKEEAEKAKKGVKDKDKKDEKKEDEDDFKEPELTPKENLLKRYRQYVQVLTEPDEEAVFQRYMSAICQAYDPHSDYMTPTRKEDFDMDMSLSLCGVGAVLSMDDGALKIVEVMKGGPVDRDKRIKRGDKIVGVGQGDGPVEDVMYKPMRKTIKKIRGPKGSKVVLEIIPRSDPSGATRKRIAIIRDEIKLEEQAATGRVEKVVMNGVTNRFGYVKLPSFYRTFDKQPDDPSFRSCSFDVAKHVAHFNAIDSDGMILDLRGNGGGALPEAVFLAQLFLWPSYRGNPLPVVLIRDPRGLQALPVFGDQPCFAYRKPLIVLTDRASASASEIVAGVLKDTGRALIIGDHSTHGKGTVQEVISRIGPEKYGSVKVTTSRFYRINGSSTQVKGVDADINLPSFLEELDIGEDKLPNALPWTRVGGAPHPRVWNLNDYAGALKAISAERLKLNPKYAAHTKLVRLFRENAESKTVSLERTKRLVQMREEREMRKAEDAAEFGDEEFADDEPSRRDEDAKKDDVVLTEAFNILADLVKLTGGNEAPDTPDVSTSAFWSIFGGRQ
jgi:carboxyl-terminal processing protease